MTENNFPEIIRDEIMKSGEDNASQIIQDWVKNGKHEDLYLDFTTKKDSSKGSLDIDDKRGFAKAISGFANSDGGLLVWGVTAKKEKNDPEAPDVAIGLAPIQPLDTFVGELNKFIKESTKPAVSGVMNLQIEECKGANKGWVVTYIPPGSMPPYRADICNNNFYKRSGSNFYPMEPFDIRDVIFRFRYPKVAVELALELKGQNATQSIYLVSIKIKNSGPESIQTYKIQIDIPIGKEIDSSSFSENAVITDITRENSPYRRFIFYSKQTSEHALYPDDEREIIGRYGFHSLELTLSSRFFEKLIELRQAGKEGPDIICRFYSSNIPNYIEQRQDVALLLEGCNNK